MLNRVGFSARGWAEAQPAGAQSHNEFTAGYWFCAEPYSHFA
jgi:hypothetical protein